MPLVTGAYQAKSLAAEAQRCVNLYMERNPQDSPFPYTCYLTPGLTPLVSVAPTLGSGWRGLYFASNNQLYGVCGSSVYSISSAWVATFLGDITSHSGPVAMVDNGSYLVIVDGSPNGWTVKLAANTFAPLASTGFLGGNTVAFMDGYLVLNSPGTNEWYISTGNEIVFDPTQFASKSGAQDLLAGLAVTKRYIYLFGQQTTEVWFDAGDTPFPMDRLPGVFMQFGCTSAASIAQMDGDLYWLAQSPQGDAIVCRSVQFNAKQISTFALANEMTNYGDLDQAIGFTYQFEGHFFYVLTFPETDVTWQYDLSTEQWNQLAWADSNGVLHRHRASCFASAYGSPVVGDWETGQLYLWDQDNYTDNGAPIVRIRSFPHGVDDSSNRIHYTEFIANFEVGNGAGNVRVPVSLRWSDTRGVSWGNPVMRSLGMEGEYLKSVQWRRLGMARDRVFELSWSAPCKTALLGAWVDAQSNNQ
ncbi:hypothetical protein C7410_115177 [Paraburkholderia silvatlantica]|uniref:Phage stabilization protein n=2 Tax=Paraburkholderia silvatlantica TaxID=321895 RepID=A0A2V4TS24_9BURK|nr:hypothetical protein C7410_115177 [Paraburkholderia silvatlantica]